MQIPHAFITIITNSHLKFALALYRSLVANKQYDFTFFCFVTDGTPSIPNDIEDDFKLLSIKDFKAPLATKIFEKYYSLDPNKYRWSMKPVVLDYLVSSKGFIKAIYLDADLYFYSNYAFLFEELNTSNVLLSPHWRCSLSPEKDWFNFTLNFMHGIYNGGFVGINQEGAEAMRYWANLCLYACEQNLLIGLHDDQKYLDILQSVFENIGVIRHKGCNVSNWNRIECIRTKHSNGEVVINNTFPIVFIHFTEGTILDISVGNDDLLIPHLKEYNDTLKSLGFELDLFKDSKSKYQKILEEYNNSQKNDARIVHWVKKLKKIKSVILDGK